LEVVMAPSGNTGGDTKLASAWIFLSIAALSLAAFTLMEPHPLESQGGRSSIPLPSSKVLLDPAPGAPQATNSFPVTAVMSPDGRYLAVLNNGRGSAESGYHQSIGVLDLANNHFTDYPDSRLAVNAHQTYFLGLVFGSDGKKLYASLASLTDPAGQHPGNTGNGVAVYGFEQGRISPLGFLKVPLQPLGTGKRLASNEGLPQGKAIPYPAGLAIVPSDRGDRLLVADNLSDDALQLDAAHGKGLQRYDLSTHDYVPSSYPYAVAVTQDGTTGYCSLWNASEVAELDLQRGGVRRRIQLQKPGPPTAAGSHPGALLLSPDQKRLYVALSNADAVAVVETTTGKLLGTFSTLLPGQKYGGSYPNALALSADARRLFVANASADAVGIFDVSGETIDTSRQALGFIPTEWYPTALALKGDDLFIVTGKGRGTGPNNGPESSATIGSHRKHPYIASLIRGSIARVRLGEAEKNLPQLTAEVRESNLVEAQASGVAFRAGSNPIRHVIYIIKENRTYDQIFGDLKPGNGDPSLVMYGEDVTPNQHALARQFGILDNFYCSGEVSGDGHVWSTAAITSDYTEKTWQIGYRGNERTYDYEGAVANGLPLKEEIPDVNEPGTGYLWALVARSGLTHRNYGEFVESLWCDRPSEPSNPTQGTPLYSAATCPKKSIGRGKALPWNVGEPHGGASPWPWPVPMLAGNVATKPELEASFDPRFPDFRVDYPDQLRVDEFLNEFNSFVQARANRQGNELPQFVLLRLPDDHTAGTRAGLPTPSASVADNDLAVGRVAEAVSHSPYWDDTAIFILEDDAQDGADHVDAHRSTALVVSKYSPGSSEDPYVESGFYTTVSMIRTIEVLLGLAPMNNNDAQAPVMAPLFSGPGRQAAFTANRRNQQNGLIYHANPPTAPGAEDSARMDFSRADAVDTARLNTILWHDRKGNAPMPPPRHSIF
jgi:6-phosphogluconolactonase (cycloisomerase 2 family)